MGDLVKMTPYSEITATLEILDRWGVRREHLDKFRGASSWLQQQIAAAIIAGDESFFSIAPVPDDNVEFQLTLNPGEADPVEMVRTDGYDSPDKWEFLGKSITEPLTKTFVHLNLGRCRNLADAKSKADELGYELADGRFRVTYRKKFPTPTRSIAVIFGGSEWQDPGGDRYVPGLGENGGAWVSSFSWSDSDFDEDCRWVASRKPARTTD